MKHYTVVVEGVVAELNGEYWGSQYYGGSPTANGFGPIERAAIADPRLCCSAVNFLDGKSPYLPQLSKARLVKIKKTVQYEVDSKPEFVELQP